MTATLREFDADKLASTPLIPKQILFVKDERALYVDTSDTPSKRVKIGRDFTQDPLAYEEAVAGIFARMINHTATEYTLADVIANGLILPVFGLKSLEFDTGEIDPETLKDVYLDIYSFVNNEDDPRYHWTAIYYDEKYNVFGIYDGDGKLEHSFYDFGTHQWNNTHNFPVEVWDQIIILDATSSTWEEDPSETEDYESITFAEGTIEQMDLEEVFTTVLQGLISKVEIDQGTASAGKLMVVNDRGFVVPSESDYVQDVQIDGVTTVSDGIADLTHLDEKIDIVDDRVTLHATDPHDFTVSSAPVGFPRNYAWYVQMNGPLQGSYQYRRYFYDTLQHSIDDQPGTPLLADAVASWVIDGKHIYFEYLNNGSVWKTVDITDVSGDPLVETFHPVPMGDTWYFGKNQLDPFPTSDNVRSLIIFDVKGLTWMIGDLFQLQTDAKVLVDAINEVNAKSAQIEIVEKPDATEAQSYSEQHPAAFVYVSSQ